MPITPPTTPRRRSSSSKSQVKKVTRRPKPLGPSFVFGPPSIKRVRSNFLKGSEAPFPVQQVSGWRTWATSQAGQGLPFFCPPRSACDHLVEGVLFFFACLFLVDLGFIFFAHGRSPLDQGPGQVGMGEFPCLAHVKFMGAGFFL